MRIGQFSDSFLPVVDGVGRVVEGYAQAMGGKGQDVTVFAPADHMGDLSHAPYEVVTYGTIPVPRLPYRVGIPQLDIPFEKAVHAVDLDIVHVHSPFLAGYSGLQYARRRCVPAVGSFHSKYYDDLVQALKVDALAQAGVKVVVDFYSQCDEVWAVSHDTAKTLRGYGYQGEIVVMPNGTEFRTLDPTVLPELTATYALDSDVPLLLYVGQMNWKKNIRHILEAMRLLAADGVPFRLLMAGQGPHEADIASTCQTLGIADRVTFTGHLGTRALDGLYTLASLFVFPSLYDNAPMVLREAAVMGTPAVLTRGSNTAEDIEDGVNGLLCDDTSASLADAIRRGLEDPALLTRIGDGARWTIPVPWDTLVDQVLDRYAMLVDRGLESRA